MVLLSLHRENTALEAVLVFVKGRRCLKYNSVRVKLQLYVKHMVWQDKDHCPPPLYSLETLGSLSNMWRNHCYHVLCDVMILIEIKLKKNPYIWLFESNTCSSGIFCLR